MTSTRRGGAGAGPDCCAWRRGPERPRLHAHDYWEELYLLEGDMTVGDPHGGERVVRAPAYACREPAFMHGPVKTEGGCLLLEFSSYPAATANT